MCGRYASTRSAADLAELFGAEDLTEGDLVPDYNVAPTDPAPIVRSSQSRGGAVLCVARWGLVPSWSRDTSGAARMINARAETVATSRVFGDAFARRRCLVPADGWFEWRRSGSHKQPFFMTRPEGVVFGGIWTVWGPQALLSFSIVTLPAIGPLATIHDRMPMVLDESRWSAWLGNAELDALATPPSSHYCSGFELRPVSAAVGDVRKDGPELLHRVAAADVDESTVDRSPTLF
jgi:putative SOS response-associated peptidase YedK